MLPDLAHTLKPGCKGGICLVGEKPDRELPGIHNNSRGAWRHCPGQRVLSCMMCVVNLVLPLSQLQDVEWEWSGRREPDDEHSPAS